MKRFILKTFFFKHDKNTTSKLVSGFTLVETMFAVLILTFTISIMMTVVASSLFAARYARDEITANYLLQEVIDYIRNDRDTTVFLGNGTWSNFYQTYSDCSSENGCYFDVLSDNVIPSACSSPLGCPLYYNKNADTTPFYINDNGSGWVGYPDIIITNFKRKIVVVQNEPDEVDVTVTVSWKNGSLDRKRELKTSFMNWQQ